MASFFETSAGLAIGYTSGGAVTQLTSKATGVTVNAPSGAITTHNASLAGNDEVTFAVTNSSVTASDVVLVSVQSGATTGLYLAFVSATAAGSFDVTLSNLGSTAGEVVVVNFAVMKAAAS
jgi:hypothetical protein